MVGARRERREAESFTMPYERLKDIVRLAVRLQGTHGGLTLDDIQADFSVKRRTAERMRDAVAAASGPPRQVVAGARERGRLRREASDPEHGELADRVRELPAAPRRHSRGADRWCVRRCHARGLKVAGAALATDPHDQMSPEVTHMCMVFGRRGLISGFSDHMIDSDDNWPP